MNKTSFNATFAGNPVIVVCNSASFVNDNVFVSIGDKKHKKIVNVRRVNIDRLGMDENRRRNIKKDVLKAAGVGKANRKLTVQYSRY